MKKRVKELVEQLRPQLVQLSNRIHDNPELMFQEYKACKWLTSILERHGFKVKGKIAGLETAFKAWSPSKAQGPQIAFLTEYDALPEIGHGCGHNIIAAASVGAAIALSKFEKLPGTIVVLGTPGEEGGGGKVKMVDAHVFDQIDVSMMVHPNTKNLVGRGALAIKELKIKFKGKSAHASAEPEKGINALDAVIQTFNNINALRQHLPEYIRIHGIITHGGIKPNIVPDYAEAFFYVRTLEEEYLPKLMEKVKKCAKAASVATGAKVMFEEGRGYKSKKLNPTLVETFKNNLERLVEKIDEPPVHGGLGSSDIGDVSWVVPAIHPYVSISDKDIPGHSSEFTNAAKSEKANDAICIGASALAWTAIDLLTDASLLEKVKKDFET